MRCLTCKRKFYRKVARNLPPPKYCGWACFQADPQQFWRHVKKTSGCWLWVGSKKGGYGRQVKEGRQRMAHRTAWELLRGPIPKGLCVLHNCPGGDNPACVNPTHLFLGTHADNIRDAAKKLQLSHGEAHRDAKLSSDKVRTIRDFYASGEYTTRQLAAIYGVSCVAIFRIIHRITWKHVA